MKSLLPFLIFSFVFLILANHHIIKTTLGGLQKSSAAVEKVANPELSQKIKQKTSIIITDFYIVNSDSLFAGMSGVPGRPVMTISKKMYETFSPAELTYVVLHETGHYVYWHPIKEFCFQLVVLFFAFFIFRHFGEGNFGVMSLSSIVCAVIAGVVMIQVMSQHEWQADTFALHNLDDPQAMVLATQKLREFWGGPEDHSLTRKLFYRGVPYSQRIEHAKNYDK